MATADGLVALVLVPVERARRTAGALFLSSVGGNVLIVWLVSRLQSAFAASFIPGDRQ